VPVDETRSHEPTREAAVVVERVATPLSLVASELERVHAIIVAAKTHAIITIALRASQRIAEAQAVMQAIARTMRRQCRSPEQNATRHLDVRIP
jgi:hypothetical protein